MNTKALRQKILDLAIHGKLVPQDPNDEPASVLLERIRAEKERLIKEGKIKRPKKTKATSDKPHYENNLPSGWFLTNIEELLINRDGERKPVSSAIRSKQKNKVYDYYGAAGIIDKVDGFIFDERLLLIGEDGANLLSRSKDNAFFAEGKYWVNNHAHVLDATDKNLLDFVAIVINAMKLDDYITGSAQPKLSQDNLNKIPIALPPLQEQKRLVKELNHWFSLVDCIEYQKDNLQNTINQTKSKILDLAIHGKLVPQDPTDEPATELLKRINPNAGITSDNGHYQKLPEGWCETILKHVITIKSGYPINVRNCMQGHYPIYGGNGITGYTVDYNIKEPTIVIGRVGFYCGSVYLVKEKAWVSDNAFTITIHKDIFYKKYLYYLIQFLNLRKYSNSTAQPVISGKTIYPIHVIIPPINEQHRIVSKIEEIFTQLDAIEASL